ncbi:Putative Sec7 domain, mon2, dimerization and cyclophilin-binding domain, Sec7 domain superfamily [Septoria linicola]|uniref:Sec7 domain, mon2, dimerization and cyclophilin-binding domain, Sec7 domain superfamily n=1 Tax=Septoria linicola TaxID=215465 RepID=A0A9Q9EGG0_9PEZI|nr:putative Sec7 domain, mon2, dimerization and cyclophilin-binding domain, Sec7 domain superfamily [Septoria linicola]USW49950.1 Putative Sec7 domain, mon2, dimerization and cyclophilin-binding domain, Sec7 domain superfamily [Septoria linicola]
MADEEHGHHQATAAGHDGTAAEDARQSQDSEEDTEQGYEQVQLDDGAAAAREDRASQEDTEHGPDQHAPQAVNNGGSTTPPPPSKEATQSNGESAPASVASPPPATNSTPDTPTTTRSVADTTRQRTDSQSTTATTATKGSVRSTRTSMVFVVSALESIAASKDARKRKDLADSTQRALSAIRTAQGDASQMSPEIMFEPLSLAAESSTESVVVSALDCIGKLISYSYFSIPVASENDTPEDRRRPPLIDRAIDTICDCFQGESTPVNVQMQIIKSLLAAILNDKIVVHGAGLLKSVRQTYNIFLLSKNSANQQIAQGTLMQMVGTVFERVKVRLANKASRAPNSGGPGSVADVHSDVSSVVGGDETPSVPDVQTPDEEKAQPKMTLQTFETRKSFDDARITDSAPTMVTKVNKPNKRPSRTGSGADVPAITVQDEKAEAITEDEEEDEIYIKDAFLIFRAMCKLSTKALRIEDAVDVKSQGMRSKLLSLHIIHTVLFNHSMVFTSPLATIRSSSNTEPTGFTHAIKQYLCLSLSRNGASSISKVFEVAAEIFSLMMKHLRSQLKRELEVFLKEIYITILEKRNAPHWQKSYIVQHVFGRIGSDSRTLVEIYLNYDCDRQALDNMYQRIIEHVSRMASQPVTVNGLQEQAYIEATAKQHSSLNDWRERGTMPPSLTTASMSSPQEAEQAYPAEYAMKIQSLECLLDALRSMVDWSQQAQAELPNGMLADSDSRFSVEDQRESLDNRAEGEQMEVPPTPRLPESQLPEDDPEELEKVKQRKTALNNAVRAFNFKPKKGIKLLIEEGFIPSTDPTDIAKFFSGNERINKKSLGEFLGEGDEENIKIMHAFVDNMDFSRTRFVDALRRFLQSFRLPGEAQKIDRLMLKFAERYLSGNPAAFANADTAYVLAYSVIMLNTDQHSAQVKKRMTVEDFIKNNRGINDNADLPNEYLQGIFDEIAHNEIVLDTERANAANLGMLPQQPSGLVNTLANVGRDLQREAYAQASEEMSNRTELLFKNLLRAQKRAGGGAAASAKGRYLVASSYRHIGPMFEVTWMSFLTALSGTAQESQNVETIRLCMEGQKLAIRIACLFDLESPRQAFVSSLSRSTNLYNLSEMKAKNVEALRALIEIAYTEGNHLKESWRDVLTSVSQLDRFQLISSGVEEGAVPDVLRANSTPQSPQVNGNRKSMQVQRRSTARGGNAGSYQADIAEDARSADMIRGVDRIFTNTANLSGTAIVDFVKALTQVSWQEIQSSGKSETPRTYSLQKLVEISGYNMLRVKFEWTSIWKILGQHFIDVGCHNNTHVVFFALNSLRQLSMRFMEIEELPGFQFQKDFLKPFELILSNAQQVPVKDMVLRCLIQMIQARGDMIRSGWRTMFGVFAVAAREPYESIVNLAFDNVTQVYNERFGVVLSQSAFADLIVCLTEFSKNMKFQKKSLQAIETLKSTVPKMLRTPECPLSQKAPGHKDAPQAVNIPKQPVRRTQEEQYWFPVLFAFHDVLMTGEDLEVRSRALNYLFDTLTKYGGDFPRDFWDVLWRQLLMPIFMVLRDRKSVNVEAANSEELSVWLSTTLIQALRNMISLFTHFFESLEYMLDRFLELLTLCICQENDTLARIGSNCLQQLILQNVKKFSPGHWEKIVAAFVDLFAKTEAKELFSAATSSSYSRDSSYTNGAPDTPKATPRDLAMDDAASVMSANTNALGINAPDDSERQNGLDRAPSTSLSLSSDHEADRSPSPAARKPSDALEDFSNTEPAHQAPVVVTAARRRYFNQIITKCVLQLLMIETVSELFNNDAVYASIPSHLLLELMALLKKSYHFAKRFNEDRELRGRLFREGFMKQPPNLLKQESGSASVYVSILLRMYADTSSERAASKPETEHALIPLCKDIIASYISLDEETQQRNIVTWRPVVIDVLEGVVAFGDQEFEKHVDAFAPMAVGLMARDMGSELQRAVMGIWQRVCEVKLGIEMSNENFVGAGHPASPGGSSTRERPGVFGTRRGSRVNSLASGR